MRNVSTTVYFSPEQSARVKALAAATKVPASALIRSALDKALPAWEAQAAAGQSLDFDAPQQEPQEGKTNG